jgi:4'-phosphopantetheinyl transferase
MSIYSFRKINKNHYFTIHIIYENVPLKSLKKSLKLSACDEDELNNITHPKRKAEFLHARLALQMLLNSLKLNYQGLTKDLKGKPYLIGLGDHISISHCYPFAAAAVSKQGSIGIDIQIINSKLVTSKKKFISDKELPLCTNDLQELAIYWCAKEAIYKAHNDNSVSLKDIHINLPYKPLYSKTSGECIANVAQYYYKVYYSVESESVKSKSAESGVAYAIAIRL